MPRKAVRDLTIEEQLARGPMDLPYLMLVLLLTGVGLVMVLSASSASSYYEVGNATYYFIRQGGFAVAGVVLMYFMSKVNYQTLRWVSVFLLGGSFICLVLVLIPGLGVEVNNARRWLKLGPIPQFQPSEILKLGIISYFAARMAKRDSEKKKPWNTRSVLGRMLGTLDRVGLLELLPYLGILGAAALLLLQEPHMSGTILILAGGGAVLFAGGVKLYWFLAAGGLAGGGLYFIISSTEYMTARINLWLDPWSDPRGKGFQTIQSLLAIGSGGLLGVGLGKSRQKFLYLPEEHNDFVFSIVCEELGLIGAVLILALFMLLILRGYWLALHARDRFGALLIVGINTLLAVQVFLNIGVVSNLFPVTGISLPFFSYGGTALMIQLIEMGIVLSVSRQISGPKG